MASPLAYRRVTRRNTPARTWAVLRLLARVGLLLPLTPFGAEAGQRNFVIPAGDATITLKQFGAQAGEQILYSPDDVRGVQTGAVHGDYAPLNAIEAMLLHTPLKARQDPRTKAIAITVRVASRALPPAKPAAPVTPPQPPPPKSSTPSAVKSRSFLTLLAGWLLAGSPAHAQSATAAATGGSGSLEVRVQSAITGDYLNNARVTVESMMLEGLTNNFGEIRFDHLPAGTVVVRVFVSGYAAKSATATISTGAPAVLNFGLSMEKPIRAGEEHAVVLDSFVVAAQREMNGSAIAINERRTAANLKSVVAADEFGDSTEGNVADFVKFLPGISVDYNAADPRFISVRGLPSFGTAVLIDGSRLANAGDGFSRATEFTQVSLNNMSRVEITKSPLPDTPADTIGGSVNMVLKSAFERARPQFNYRVHLNTNFTDAQGENFATFSRTALSPGNVRTMRPGFDFSYINPVSKNFGFTLTALHSSQFSPAALGDSTWRPTTANSALATAANPFLSNFNVLLRPKEITRWSLGTTLDWRLGANDVISARVQWNQFNTRVHYGDIQFDINGTTSATPRVITPTTTESVPGGGRVSHSVTVYHGSGTSHNLGLTHRHSGPVWTVASGASYSDSTDSHKKVADDHVVKTLILRLPSVTMKFDGINHSIPTSVSTTTAAGAPVDYRDLGNYTLVSATTGTPEAQWSATKSAYASASRWLNLGVPVRVKTGFDVRREDRDYRTSTTSWTFVGRDRVANSGDELARFYDLVAEDYSKIKAPFNFGQFQRPSVQKAYLLIQEHPDYFTRNETTEFTGRVTQSRNLSETVAAGFLRGDVSFFRSRLKLAGGFRYERTFDDGVGVLDDISATYQKDASGRIVRNAANQPVRISTDALAVARLRYTELGTHGSRDYGQLYPSLNVTYQATEKILLRSSYARTITRPQLDNIVPTATATDPTSSARPTITVNNVALQPWTANSYDVAVEYYFDQPGIISVGAFRKDIKNFFGAVRTAATPELLDLYGFDDSYLNYEIVTKTNIGSARVSGVEFEYRQSLESLHRLTRGISIFSNVTALHVDGGSSADLAGFIRKSANWGVALGRPRYTVRLNWNYRGRQRTSLISGANVPSGTYRYANPRLSTELNAEARLTRHVALFTTVRNLTNIAWRSETYGPTTPAYARGTNWSEYGPQAVLGVKGTF